MIYFNKKLYIFIEHLLNVMDVFQLLRIFYIQALVPTKVNQLDSP